VFSERIEGPQRGAKPGVRMTRKHRLWNVVFATYPAKDGAMLQTVANRVKLALTTAITRPSLATVHLL
jgi:phage head maturation protease